MRNLIAMFLFIMGTTSFTQNTSNKDHILRRHFIGSWTHVHSIYPSGNVTDYYQEFDFRQDGSGTCIRIEKGDTVAISIRWLISEGKVFLYTILEDGRMIHGDTILLTHLDEERFFGDKVYGPYELRKTCMYKRKVAIVA
jgi:hypothetical protein